MQKIDDFQISFQSLQNNWKFYLMKNLYIEFYRIYTQNVDIKTEEFYRKVADERLFKVEAYILLLK